MSYIPHSQEDIQHMLDTIGVSSIDELFKDIPEILFTSSFKLPEGESEFNVLQSLKHSAEKNNSNLVQFAGGGFYDHYIPPAVDYVSSRGEFYTAYTPYQPEASQGTLQALYEYQSAICELTGMDIANASLYDGGTAITEAMLMALRKTRRTKVLVDSRINPLYREMIQTSFLFLDYEIEEIPFSSVTPSIDDYISRIDDTVAAVVVENPNFFGELSDYSKLADALHANKSLLIMSVYPVSLGMVKTPAEMNADIVTAEGQCLGNYLNFGGPYLGIIACTEKLVRNLPGRIAGKTLDTHNRDAYVLTLQAREQHIRRQKATSNICSNQNLCALRALVYLSLLGPDGIEDLARTNHSKTCYMKNQLESLPGVSIDNCSFFNTLCVDISQEALPVHEKLMKHNISFGIPLSALFPDKPEFSQKLLLTVTEKRSLTEINEAIALLKEVL